MRHEPPSPPSRHLCPDCGARLIGVHCPTCGLVPVGPDAEALWQIDQQLHHLAGRRGEVLGRLRAQSVPGLAGPASGEAAPAEGSGPTSRAFLPPPPPPHTWPDVAGPFAASAPGAGGGVSLANLLLGLGTGLVVLAAAVFVAVSWAHLTAAAQGLLLLGLTAAGVWGTRSLRRRGLTGTAEAIAVVTVALLPVDAEAVREAAQAPGLRFDPGMALVGWCLAIAAMAGASWWFGRFSGTRAPLVAAALAAQVPVPLLVVGWPVDRPAGLVVILAQAAVTLATVRGAGGGDRAARITALAGAGLLWFGATVAAFGDGVGEDAGGRGVAAGIVALAAGVAALTARLWSDDDGVRPLVAGTATAVALTSTGLAVSVVAEGAAWTAAMAGVAVGATAVAVRVPRRWGDAPSWVTGTAAAVLSLPLVIAVATTVTAALEAADPPWMHGAWTSTRVVAEGVFDVDGLGRVPVAVHLGAAACAALAVRPRLGDRAAATGLAASGIAGLVLLPLFVDLPLAATVTAVLAGAGAACIALVRLRRDSAPGSGRAVEAADGGRRRTFSPEAPHGPDAPAVFTTTDWAPMPPIALAATVGVVGLAILALAWAAAAAATTVAAVATVGVLAAAVATVAGRGGDSPLAHTGAAAVVVAGAADAGFVSAALGASTAASWAAVALAAAGASAAAAWLDPAGTRTDLRGDMSRSTVVAAAVVHVGAAVAVVATGHPALTTVVLAGGAATAALHALLRPGRLPAAAVAATEALVLVWLRLAWADVAVPEAYTLPVAVVLLAAALVARHRGLAGGRPSWSVDGPWLVAAVAPTVLLAVDDPGLVRPLGGLVVGVAVLIAGAITRTRAAVDVGGVTVAVLGLHQLSPVVAELPNWATLGTCGVMLLVVGATFEQRRRDLGIVRTRYADLS